MFILSLILSFILVKGRLLSEFRYYDLALMKCGGSQNYTIHGWWPEFDSKHWPQFCHSSRFDLGELKRAGLLGEMNLKWRSCYGRSDTFWQHEWLKHGTCSGLNITMYFQSTLEMFNWVEEQGWIIPRFCGGTGNCLIHFNLNYTLRG